MLAKYGHKAIHIELYEEMLSTYLYLSYVFMKPVKCIYGIYSKFNNTCIYVGCSTNFYNRIQWHHYEYALYPKRKLYQTITLTGGWNNYYFKLIENIENINTIFLKEHHYIKELSPTSNTLSPPKKHITVDYSRLQ